jgi:hypothetical protein
VKIDARAGHGLRIAGIVLPATTLLHERRGPLVQREVRGMNLLHTSWKWGWRRTM